LPCATFSTAWSFPLSYSLAKFLFVIWPHVSRYWFFGNYMFTYWYKFYIPPNRIWRILSLVIQLSRCCFLFSRKDCTSARSFLCFFPASWCFIRMGVWMFQRVMYGKVIRLALLRFAKIFLLFFNILGECPYVATGIINLDSNFYLSAT